MPDRTPIPRDDALPQMEKLLDPEAMASFLGRSLGREERPPHVHIPYNRYKPGQNLAVHYEVSVDGETHHAVAMTSSDDELTGLVEAREHVERAKLVGDRSPAQRPLLWDSELRSLFQWLPFDIDLPALSQSPRSLRRRLAAAGVALAPADGEPALLQYRPRRRVALRLDGHVVKIYRDEKTYRAGVAGLEASAQLGSIRTARGEAFVPEWLLTVQELLPGDALVRRADAAYEAGALLAELHRTALTGLPPLLPQHRLKQVAAAVNVVSAVTPHLATRARALLAELERTSPELSSDALVPSHGDFHGGQLLAQSDGYALIDFDLLAAGPPAYDLANYAGHLVPKEAPDLAASVAVLDRLVAAYGRRPPFLPWYLAASILRRARVPFRNFEPDWPRGVEVMVGAAEAAFRL
ncbi:MAG: phosphotransferase family protein [Gaiellaceae bacterium]